MNAALPGGGGLGMAVLRWVVASLRKLEN